jgi:hypothetical protein
MTSDWTIQDNVQAKLRVIVKKLLRNTCIRIKTGESNPNRN